MAYASWSVVFGEQPSAAKWNILGTNDASFNDGTGIGSRVITNSKMQITWTSYVPTISVASGTAPTYTSTSTGKYYQLDKVVHMQFTVQNSAGGTAGSGAGTLRFSLPVTASVSITAGGTVIGGIALVYNGAATGFTTTTLETTSLGNFRGTDTTLATGASQNSTSRFLYAELTYEAA